ncbi:hypothetical protein N9S53_01490, partial [Candidatus Pelagibacter sp.]|nr:hypothetical protein [Candidatus Pelagibacter sp.]
LFLAGFSLYYSKQNPDSGVAKLIRKAQIITINYMHLAMWFEYDEWTIHRALVDMSDLKNIQIKKIETIDLLKADMFDVYDPIYYSEGFAYERCGYKEGKHFCDNVFVPNTGKSFNRLNTECKTSYPISFILEQKEYWLFEEFFCKKGLILYSRDGDKFEVVTTITSSNVFDPTPVVIDDMVYVFGTQPGSGLMLWQVKKVDDKWVSKLDERSPISSKPNSNRFGGNIFEWDGKLYGAMMDNRVSYGDSLGLFEINMKGSKKILTEVTNNLLPNLKADKYHTFSIGNCSEDKICEVLIDIGNHKKQPFHGAKYYN